MRAFIPSFLRYSCRCPRHPFSVVRVLESTGTVPIAFGHWSWPRLVINSDNYYSLYTIVVSSDIRKLLDTYAQTLKDNQAIVFLDTCTVRYRTFETVDLEGSRKRYQVAIRYSMHFEFVPA